MAEEQVPGGNEQIQERQKEKVKEPPMYKVILHNDDYTTMEFVVEVLKRVFRKPAIEAHAIMMKVHKKGAGVVGTYPYDIAATKVQQTRKMAEENGYPLKCTMEAA